MSSSLINILLSLPSLKNEISALIGPNTTSILLPSSSISAPVKSPTLPPNLVTKPSTSELAIPFLVRIPVLDSVAACLKAR